MSYTRKLKLLIPAGILVLLFCWVFAFSKTYEAIRLNWQTSQRIEGEEPADLSYNEAYNQRKVKAIDEIIQSYQTRKSVQGNELWLKVSAIAASLKVSIEYTSAAPALSIDTNSIGVNQTLYFYGKYVPLVKLIDSIEHTQGIGKIAGLQIQSMDKDRAGAHPDNSCKLKLILKSLPRN